MEFVYPIVMLQQQIFQEVINVLIVYRQNGLIIKENKIYS